MAAYSVDLRERIVSAVERQSGSKRKIAELFGVHDSFIYKLLRHKRGPTCWCGIEHQFISVSWFTRIAAVCRLTGGRQARHCHQHCMITEVDCQILLGVSTLFACQLLLTTPLTPFTCSLFAEARTERCQKKLSAWLCLLCVSRENRTKHKGFSCPVGKWYESCCLRFVRISECSQRVSGHNGADGLDGQPQVGSARPTGR